MNNFNPPFLGKIQRPHFCKEAINIGDFCNAYGKEVDEILPGGAKWVTLRESMDMPAPAMSELAEICSVDHLLCEGEPKANEPSAVTGEARTNFHTKCAFPNITADLSGGWGSTINEEAARKLKSLRFQRHKERTLNRSRDRSRLLFSNLRYHFETRLESEVSQSALSARRAHMKTQSDLEAVVSVRLYRTPRHSPAVVPGQGVRFSNQRLFNLAQEVLCLGTNHLTALRDEICCPNDQLVINDFSQAPRDTRPVIAKEEYPSGFFCINSAFYVDDRDPRSIDYTEPIREWAAGRLLDNLQHGSMTGVRLQDLNVRIGYPYIYVHQGNCQHLMVFSDVRLFRPGFDVGSASYPRTVATRRPKSLPCHLCSQLDARWLTMDHELTPTNPTLFCGTCFTEFNYFQSKPICSFKAYPLHPKSARGPRPGGADSEKGDGRPEDGEDEERDEETSGHLVPDIGPEVVGDSR